MPPRMAAALPDKFAARARTAATSFLPGQKCDVYFALLRARRNHSSIGDFAMDIGSQFDVLLKGGRVICPASGIDGVMDIAVQNGRVAAIQQSILPTSAKEVIDVAG